MQARRASVQRNSSCIVMVVHSARERCASAGGKLNSCRRRWIAGELLQEDTLRDAIFWGPNDGMFAETRRAIASSHKREAKAVMAG